MKVELGAKETQALITFPLQKIGSPRKHVNLIGGKYSIELHPYNRFFKIK
jgi:hypothetical protein